VRGRAVVASIATGSSLYACGCRPSLCDRGDAGRPHRDADRRSLLEQWLNPPPFHLESDRFDMSSYGGRALHYLNVLGDLSTLIITPTQCEAHLEVLRQHGCGKSGISDEQLWRARKVKEAMVHPESGEIIPPPFRFSAFAPANLVICAGLLWASNVSLAATAFWQWVNQSYNVAVNHCNRSSGSTSPEQLAAAYCGATTTAISVAMALQTLGHRLGHLSGRLIALTVPMVGVSLGGVVNLLITRSAEWYDGLEVSTADGHPVGVSHLAAEMALAKCSATRVAWTVLLLTAAPLVAGLALRCMPSTRSWLLSNAVDLTTSFLVIWVSVPLCIAIWPQRDCMPVARLETHLQGATHPVTGEPVQHVYFNKGL